MMTTTGHPIKHFCRQCGQRFDGGINTHFCSGACYMRAWRAVGMLAGTHGNVDGQFKRIQSTPA